MPVAISKSMNLAWRKGEASSLKVCSALAMIGLNENNVMVGPPGDGDHMLRRVGKIRWRVQS